MKKSLQVYRDIIVTAGDSKIINFQLKENYAKCTGFFLAPSSVGTDFSVLTIGLDIAQQEILPKYVDASLFAINNHISRDEATYDFSDDNIPARSSDVQMTIVNAGAETQKFNAYFVLSNK